VCHLLGGDPEHAAGKATDGLLLTIDRLSFDDDRAQQHAERAGVRDGAALIGGDVPRQRVLQSHALDEMVDEGKRAEALAV
jgi:hypothetical protein